LEKKSFSSQTTQLLFHSHNSISASKHTILSLLIQRIMGFGITFTCGYLMTFMSFRLFIKLVEGNPAPFVFLYTSGNIMSLMSSMFLSGPKRQCTSMFDEKRRATSITYLVSLACSIAVCFIPIPTGPKIGMLVLCEYFTRISVIQCYCICFERL